MESLIIPKFSINEFDIDKIKVLFKNIPVFKKINNVNWQEYPYKPNVQFKIAYTDSSILIMYNVTEKGVRGIVTKPNGEVWEDSCCEFFCSFDSTSYYNIEINCIGTPLMGWGKDKINRSNLDNNLVERIKTWSSLGKTPIEPTNIISEYDLIVSIPFSNFIGHKIQFKKDFRFKANLYKCGDKTPQPHFLSWNSILYDEINFHKSEFFGEMVLM